MSDEANTPAVTPAADTNTLIFRIPNTETDCSVDLAAIPADTRMQLLKTAVRAYIVNSVNQVNLKHVKAVAPFTAYAEAMKADALQTAVAEPEGEAPVLDLLTPAAEARQRLYDGKMRVQVEASNKPKAPKDPLIKAITDVVVREYYDRTKLTNNTYKWGEAVKEIGGDGLAYLNAKLAEKVAQGADKAVLDKFMQERYIKPARIMLGLDITKATSGERIL